MGHFKIVRVKLELGDTINELLDDLESVMNNAVNVGYDSLGTPQIHQSDLNSDNGATYAYSLMYRHEDSSLTDKEENKKIYK